MKIDTASTLDVLAVAEAMRPRDLEEFSAVLPADAPMDVAYLLASRYGFRPDVLCGSLDGEPICIGGAIEARPCVATLLFFATARFPDIAIPITRFIKRTLFPRLAEAGVRRVECVTLEGYEESQRWLRQLGLEAETGPMQRYGKRGEAFIQFWMPL